MLLLYVFCYTSENLNPRVILNDNWRSLTDTVSQLKPHRIKIPPSKRRSGDDNTHQVISAAGEACVSHVDYGCHSEPKRLSWNTNQKKGLFSNFPCVRVVQSPLGVKSKSPICTEWVTFLFGMQFLGSRARLQQTPLTCCWPGTRKTHIRATSMEGARLGPLSLSYWSVFNVIP